LLGSLATWAPRTACSHPSDTAAASFQSDSLCEPLRLLGHRSYGRSVLKKKVRDSTSEFKLVIQISLKKLFGLKKVLQTSLDY